MHINVQPVIALHIAVKTVTIFRKREHIRFTLLVKGIITKIKGFSVYGGTLQIVHDVGTIHLHVTDKSIGIGNRGGTMTAQNHCHAKHDENKQRYNAHEIVM